MSNKLKEQMIHELLAVEGDLEAEGGSRLKGATSAFSNKPNLFQGAQSTTMLYDEGARQPQPEQTVVEETVPGVLEHVFEALKQTYNVSFSKDRANQNAVASVIIDGEILIEDAPVTWLLNMETKLKRVRIMLDAIPTLRPGIRWVKDETHELEDVFITANDVEVPKTKKVRKFISIAKATKEHPEQVAEDTETQVVGHITKVQWSSLISPHEKSKLIEKLDKLLRAVKKARQQANTTSVESSNAGGKIASYLLS